MTKSSIEYLRGSSGGRIINVTTSFYGMLRIKSQPYGPSKSGCEAMSASHAAEFSGEGITVNVVEPGGPSDTPMVPVSFGHDRKDLERPEAMTYPALWLCSREGDGITGNKYLAGLWHPDKTVEENRKVTESPLSWPDLAQNPVWPGEKPGT